MLLKGTSEEHKSGEEYASVVPGLETSLEREIGLLVIPSKSAMGVSKSSPEAKSTLYSRN